MARNEMCREITAEQMYQEDLLEHAYRTSGEPDFVRRADAMQSTFESRASSSNSGEFSTSSQVVERTVFEA